MEVGEDPVAAGVGADLAEVEAAVLVGVVLGAASVAEARAEAEPVAAGSAVRI